jgi:predicted transcriptional regulator
MTRYVKPATAECLPQASSARDHEMESAKGSDLLRLASDIVAAYVSNNPVPVSELPGMIKNVHATLGTLSGAPAGEVVTNQKPAVTVKKSITPEYLICLEDGKRLKMLKRYLRSRYGLSPDQYRTKWGLPPDYPMVASNYAAQRSEFAKKIGLGKPVVKGRRRG